MSSGFVAKFGSQPIAPANPSFQALTIAANQALVWPTETVPGVPYVAALNNITASANGLELMMPNALQGATGVVGIFTNVGADTFTLTDQSGNAIAVIPTTQSWIIALINNTTANGTWQALQLASTTSSATAASLAGAGLQAIASLLNTALGTVSLAVNTLLTTADRSDLVVWTGGSGTLSFDTIANLGGGGWWCAITNQGAGTLTLAPTGGATINGAATIQLPPGAGAIVVCSAGGFNTCGNLSFPIAVAQGGTGATSAPAAAANLGATTFGYSLFTTASQATALALLGFVGTTFSEYSISANTLLTTSSSLSIIVCTAPLILTLPITTSVTTSFVFAVNAQGGTVTVTPNAADSINGAAAGTSYILLPGQSAFFATDAAGNWWPLLTGGASNAISYAPTDQSGAGLNLSGSHLKWTQTGNLVTVYGEIVYPVTADSRQCLFTLPVPVPNQPYASVFSGIAGLGASGLLPGYAIWPQVGTSNAKIVGIVGGASVGPQANSQLSAQPLSFVLTYPAT